MLKLHENGRNYAAFIAVCIYRLVMMSIDLSKKFTLHMQKVTGSVDVIVTQLLCYHMPLLYCMQPFNLYCVTAMFSGHKLHVRVSTVFKPKLNDCIRNKTAVCNPGENSVRDKIQPEKNVFCHKKIFVRRKICLGFCLELTVTKVSCLRQVNAHHHKAVYRNYLSITKDKLLNDTFWDLGVLLSA